VRTDKVTQHKLPRDNSTPTNHNQAEPYLRRSHFSLVYFDQTHISPSCRWQAEIPIFVSCQNNHHTEHHASLGCCQPQELTTHRYSAILVEGRLKYPLLYFSDKLIVSNYISF